MGNYMFNLEYYKLKSIIGTSDFSKLCLLVGFGIFQGLAISFWGIKGAGVTLGAAYLYFVFRWPHLALVFAVIIILDGFGFIDPETFLHVPGFFKVKDLVFVPLFFPLLFNVDWQRRANYVIRHQRIILFPILAILILTAFQMVRTSLQHSLPLKSCIMAGSDYWYYAFLPLTSIYLDNPEKRKIVLGLFLAVALTVAVMIITQTLTLIQGGELFLTDIQTQSKLWGPIKMMRIYLPGSATIVLAFSIAFWGFFSTPTGRQRMAYFALMLLCASAVLLTNGRMLWAEMAILILAPLLLLRKYLNWSTRRSLILTAYILTITIFVFSFSGSISFVLSGITKRFVSSFTDVRQKEGTWKYRLEDSAFRFRLIKEHPLLGLGLVHNSYGPRFGAPVKTDWLGRQYTVISTSDSGIVTLLIHFGAVGVIWAIWYFVSVLRFCLDKIKFSQCVYIKTTSIAIIGYMIAGVFAFVTLGLFTQPPDIVSCSLVLGIIASHTGALIKPQYSQR